jgi:hypothetical protein
MSVTFRQAHWIDWGEGPGSVLARGVGVLRALVAPSAQEHLHGPSFADLARRRQAAWYHASRARRALDRADWTAAEDHAHQALESDQYSVAGWIALGEAYLRRPEPDLLGARQAFERAHALKPTDGYVIGDLLAVYDRLADWRAGVELLRRAIDAGAARGSWGVELRRRERAIALRLAS